MLEKTSTTEEELFGRNVPRPVYPGMGGVKGHNINREAPPCLSRPDGMSGELQSDFLGNHSGWDRNRRTMKIPRLTPPP
jgi:hypothetical protein